LSYRQRPKEAFDQEAKLLNYRVFIAGLARNCADKISASLERLRDISRSFSAAEFVFVTNDNTDATKSVLSRWVADVPNGFLIELDGVAKAIPNGLERIAFARNSYLLEMRRRIRAGGQFDLLLVADLDGPNHDLVSGEAFETAILAAPSDWGALFPNQKQAYYDLFALRHPKWCPDDCWADVDRAVTFPFRNLKKRAAIRRYVHERQVLVDPSEPPIPVHSAFGGLGLYKTPYLENAWYSAAMETGRPRCEHVNFHQCLRDNGAHLYILPSLLNSAPDEHRDKHSGKKRRPWI
jgi:hypothetical protein